MDVQALLHIGVILATAGSLTPGQLQEMKAEASRIWEPYGVGFAWLEPAADDRRPLRPLDLVVRLRRDEHDLARVRPLDREALGSIRENTVSLAIEAISRMVLTAPMADVPVAGWPGPTRDRMLGRAYGRVFAHEIGHFLLGIPTHDTTGIMRPAFNARDLTLPGSAQSAIGSTLIVRLRGRLALLRAAQDGP
jgi:hypothetical protein